MVDASVLRRLDLIIALLVIPYVVAVYRWCREALLGLFAVAVLAVAVAYLWVVFRPQVS
jgi:hypothetical protein